jgi:hypothetical protein
MLRSYISRLVKPNFWNFQLFPELQKLFLISYLIRRQPDRSRSFIPLKSIFKKTVKYNQLAIGIPGSIRTIGYVATLGTWCPPRIHGSLALADWKEEIRINHRKVSDWNSKNVWSQQLKLSKEK